jgi:hypothetical protein
VIVASFLLAGCGELEEEKPPPIPAPETPTDRFEARRVEAALAGYRRDTRLIAQERASCGRGLPPGLFAEVCGPDVSPVVDQRAFRLRDSLGMIRRRVGPRCTPALEEVLRAPVSAAEEPLAAAASTCRAEYERARARG